MYNEENQDEAAQLMKKKGFEMGRMVHPLNDMCIPNALASTTEDGPFWYGDITFGDVAALVDIATELGKSIELQSLTSSITQTVRPNSK